MSGWVIVEIDGVSYSVPAAVKAQLGEFELLVAELATLLIEIRDARGQRILDELQSRAGRLLKLRGLDAPYAPTADIDPGNGA